MGNWPVAFVQANYPLSANQKTYKDIDHPEQNPTGHSIRQYDGLLTVWYD
jgi:hypothetical protein